MKINDFFKFLCNQGKKPEKSIVISKSGHTNRIPLVEGSKILPYLHRENNVIYETHKDVVFEFGFRQEYNYVGRDIGKKKFDSVYGIDLGEGLVLSREVGGMFYYHNSLKLVQKYGGGRFPTFREFEIISRNINDINASLNNIGENTLYDGYYWVSDTPEWEDTYQAHILTLHKRYMDMDDQGYFLHVNP